MVKNILQFLMLLNLQFMHNYFLGLEKSFYIECIENLIKYNCLFDN